MKISVHDYSFRKVLRTGELDAAGVIRYLKEIDVTAVELTEPFVHDSDIDAIQTALSETGSQVASYVIYCDLVKPDTLERQTQVNHIKKHLERAALLGTPCVCVLPSGVFSVNSEISPVVARNWISEGLIDCMADASRLGITLNMENLGSETTLYGSSEDLLTICDSIGPEFKLTYDVGNWVIAGEDALQALDKIAPRVVHVHFKDWHILLGNGEMDETLSGVEGCYEGVDGRYYDGAVLGEGEIDLKGAVKRLGELNYDGCISVEYEGRKDPREMVRRGAEYLQSLLEGSL